MFSVASIPQFISVETKINNELVLNYVLLGYSSLDSV